MAVRVNVFVGVVGVARELLRGYSFSPTFTFPPTNEELTAAINDALDAVSGPNYPTLSKWLAKMRPEIEITLLGVYRDI